MQKSYSGQAAFLIYSLRYPMKSAMPPSAQSFLIAAAGHAASAELLRDTADCDPDNGIYSVSMWFLMGWAVELSLKAAILYFGGSQADCKRAGHDLSAALAAAKDVGYVTKLTNLPNLVSDLNLTHQTHFFRYMPEADTEVPGDSALALAVLKALIVEIGSHMSSPTVVQSVM